MADDPAATLEVDDFYEAIELFHRRGWTDGLPVVPPTPGRVDAFLAAAGRTADQPIGYYALRNRPILAGKLAVNAVMAGCLPEHFPVVVAIVEGMLEPEFQLHIINSSTGSPVVGFIVNGPIRLALGMNSYGNMLGPGNRANSSIGRAIRLIQINVMGSIPGAGSPQDTEATPALDRATMGEPAKYAAYHAVENEEDYPTLTPLHVERGFAPEQSTVTVLPLWEHLMLSNHAEETPDEWIDSTAKYLLGAGRLMDDCFGALLLPQEAAQLFVAAGWDKGDIRRALYERCRRSTAWVKENGWKIGGRFERGGEVLEGDDEAMLSITASPDDLLVVVCGGPAGNFPVYLHPFGANCWPVTKVIGPAT